MPIRDIQQDIQPKLQNGKVRRPKVSDLVAAIKASPKASSYPDKTLNEATYNDLVYICRQENIAVTATAVP
jgi:hypothetical protein